MIARWCLILAFALASAHAADDGRRVPTIDELMSIRQAGSTAISPEGRWVAYTVSQPDFEEDDYVSQIWLVETSGGEPFQLTRGKESAGSPSWSPDNSWLAFRRSENGKSQIYAIRPSFGEAVRLTDAENGVSEFDWSPDGKQIAFIAAPAESEERKARDKHLGEYSVVRKDYRYSHIWTFSVEEALSEPQKGKQRTAGSDFSTLDIAWSPDGSRIAFSAAVNPDLARRDTADLYLLDLQDDSVRKIVSMPGPDTNPEWSPDGSEIVFSSVMGASRYYALNSELAVVSAQGGEVRSITDDFDEDAYLLAWKPDGIYFQGFQKTALHIFRVDRQAKTITRVSRPDELIAGAVSFTGDGQRLAFRANSPETLREVYVSDTAPFAPKRLTDFTSQTEDLVLARPEVISWESRDGTTIEGVLLKPADFDAETSASEKRPLLCVIHGGPTGIDLPGLLQRGTRYYPVDLWTARGAFVLAVNYRGSAGYGEKFRRLNERNLGVGDAWDVLSGVDHLIEKGWVDPQRVGCMGWSQGGYISAFLTTSSDRFAAISVGAGISNWATYYYNTDITPFTVNYLGDTPSADPEIYAKTSPMTYIRQAKTPTLIQHGEFDRRVPTPNGYELRQGLEDQGVDVEMIVYKSFGHGINKPRAMRGVMRHNLEWFNHHLWGDPRPDFTNPETPKPDSDSSKEGGSE